MTTFAEIIAQTADRADTENMDEPPTSAVDIPTQAAEPAELAWSQADDDGVLWQSWRSTWGLAAVSLMCATVVAFVIGVVGWVVFRKHEDAYPSQEPWTPPMAASSLPPISSAPAEPPPHPTMTAEPPLTTTVTATPTLLPSAVASADDRYIAILTADGLHIVNRNNVIVGAHWVCEGLRQGESRDQVMQTLMSGNSTLTRDNATTLIVAASTVYCPEYGG